MSQSPSGAPVQRTEAPRQHSTWHHKSGIAHRVVRLADLPTHEDVLAAHLDADPEYRRAWERTALARAVAVKVIAYRVEHGISQTRLARRLGMSPAGRRSPRER